MGNTLPAPLLTQTEPSPPQNVDDLSNEELKNLIAKRERQIEALRDLLIKLSSAYLKIVEKNKIKREEADLLWHEVQWLVKYLGIEEDEEDDE
jgi:hypothetical protein